MYNENFTLTDYEIKGILGRGTFSKVKLGINKNTKQKVAIKIIDTQFILDKNNYERIKREIYILKKSNHPNIIKVYDIKEDSKNYYIIMEYCKYGELFQQIISQKHLDINSSSFYFFQLINGLSYLHSHQIIHRDLKPENILIGEYKLLKIIDFGLSNFSMKDEYLSTPCGSPSYAPPEMIGGKKYNGMLGDIWSCGIILYVMICGYLPFDGKSNADLFDKILKCKVKYPKNIDKNALNLLKNILVNNPDKRINLEKIKKHQFYLKGKKIFEAKYPELVDKIENINNILLNNSFIKDKHELENMNKLNNDDNNNYKSKYKAFENQKENLIKYIQVNNIKNKKETTNENNLYKSNLILKTKNINYYKRILSERLNTQKNKNSYNNIYNKTNPNINSIDNCKKKAPVNKKDKYSKSKNVPKNNKNKNKTIDNDEKKKKRPTQKSATITLAFRSNYIKHNEHESPNNLKMRKLIKNSKIFEEEEKNLHETYGVQKDTHNFNINNTIKVKAKTKKIYQNEINISDKNYQRLENMTEERTPIMVKLYINNNISPLKKCTSTFNHKKPNNKNEEISKSNFDSNYNKDNSYKNKAKTNLLIKEKFLPNKKLNMKFKSYKLNKSNEYFYTDIKNKTISININHLNKTQIASENKKNYSQRKEIIISNNKENKNNKDNKNKNKSNKFILANKLYNLSNIKKNFNTCNDILNSSKGKEDFKNYIISHNKISLSNDYQKYINNQNLKKDLNQSENIDTNKHKNKKNNSIILEDNEPNILKKIRSNSNNKNFNCSTYKLNNSKYLKNKKILITDESKDTHKIKILKKKNKIQ